MARASDATQKRGPFCLVFGLISVTGYAILLAPGTLYFAFSLHACCLSSSDPAAFLACGVSSLTHTHPHPRARPFSWATWMYNDIRRLLRRTCTRVSQLQARPPLTTPAHSSSRWACMSSSVSHLRGCRTTSLDTASVRRRRGCS